MFDMDINQQKLRSNVISFLWRAAFVSASLLSLLMFSAPRIVLVVQLLLAALTVVIVAYQIHNKNLRLGIPSVYWKSLERLTFIGLLYGPLVCVITMVLGLAPCLILQEIAQTGTTDQKLGRMIFVAGGAGVIWYHTVRALWFVFERQVDQSIFTSADALKIKNSSTKRGAKDEEAEEPSFLFLLFKLISEVTAALVLLVGPIIVLHLKLMPLGVSPVVQVGLAVAWICMYIVTLVSFFLRTQTIMDRTAFRFTNATAWPVNPLSGNRSEFALWQENASDDVSSYNNERVDSHYPYKALQKNIPEINDRFRDQLLALYNNGLMEEAICFVREALEHAPHGTTLFWGAAIHLEAGYLDEARGLIHEFAGLDPEMITPHIERQFFSLWLEYCLLRGDLKGAERVIRKRDAHPDDSKDVLYLALKALFYLYRNKPHSALLLLDDIAQYCQQSKLRLTMYLAYTAWAYGQKRDPLLSDEYFHKALESVTNGSKPMLSDVYLFGGYASLALGDQQEAEARFQTAIAHSPNTLFAHHARIALETQFGSEPPEIEPAAGA